MLDVAVLAVLQGVAEFLPISSSGHLVIAQSALGMQGPGLRLNVMLHLGTLVSIFVFYYRSIVQIFAERKFFFMFKLLISSLPAVIVYFLFGDFFNSMFSNVRMTGALMMFTGAILLGTRFLPKGGRDVSAVNALVMGFAQALALLPGISRSGMTIASARMQRIDTHKCAEFSFLMSAPLIAGGAVLEFIKSVRDVSAVQNEPSWALTAFGAVIAAVVGYFSLKILIKALGGKWFWLFGPYCIAVGLLTLLFA
jgi:undecaprenyl-diphosphatase